MSDLPRLSLILGGARSGKSRYAEALAARYGRPAVYVATAQATDAEMAARIAQHQAQRGSGWRTIEEPLALAQCLGVEAAADCVLLVDCLTLWLSNVMAADKDVDHEIAALVAGLEDLPGPVILVANEVGHGIVPMNAVARRFRDHAGLLHQRLAAIADHVVFVVAGLGQVLK